jgi:hypothetical protein
MMLVQKEIFFSATIQDEALTVQHVLPSNSMSVDIAGNTSSEASVATAQQLSPAFVKEDKRAVPGTNSRLYRIVNSQLYQLNARDSIPAELLYQVHILLILSVKFFSNCCAGLVYAWMDGSGDW